MLIYTAGGKIHTLDPTSGAQGSIPFCARITLTRETYKRKSPEIPKPGARLPVRGIYRPVPSPVGNRIAFAALGSRLEKPAPDAAYFKRWLEVGKANVAAAQAAGIPVVTGTDYYDFSGLAVHYGLELLVAAGLSPGEALRAATQNAAATLGLEGRLGSIAPGAIADLVVLEADPLEDVRNTQKIYAVIQQGRIVDRDGPPAGRH